MNPIVPDLPEDRDAEIWRRWPPDRFPALYLPPAEYLALRARQQQVRDLLELLGPDIANLVLETLEVCRG